MALYKIYMLLLAEVMPSTRVGRYGWTAWVEIGRVVFWQTTNTRQNTQPQRHNLRQEEMITNANKGNKVDRSILNWCVVVTVTIALLFIIYINDMSAAVESKLLLNAVDSVLLASGKDLVELEATLSSELESQEWLVNLQQVIAPSG